METLATPEPPELTSPDRVSVEVNLDILAVGQPRPINHQFQTYRCTAPTEAMGQCTKSLRDSPLRRAA
jgi:hypothetical protein